MAGDVDAVHTVLTAALAGIRSEIKQGFDMLGERVKELSDRLALSEQNAENKNSRIWDQINDLSNRSREIERNQAVHDKQHETEKIAASEAVAAENRKMQIIMGVLAAAAVLAATILGKVWK